MNTIYIIFSAVFMAESNSGPTSLRPCAVCCRLISVTAAGLIRQHGPLPSRCPGSHQQPGSGPSVSAPLSQQPHCPDGMHAASRPPHRLSTDSQQRPLPPKCLVKILKRIPHASREQAAAKLAKILDAIVSKDGHDDHVSCDRLLQFSAQCFRVPARRAKRCSLASMVNGQLREEVDPPVLRQTARSNCQSTKSFAKDPMAYLASRVSSKLEQGDFKGAVRLACSDATNADNSSATFEELQQKHPHPHPASSIIPLAKTTGLLPPITVSEEEIVRAIRSFPNDSTRGPDGLRPQHLNHMTGPITNGGAQALISALSRFVTVVLEGKVPMSIRPFLFGASLMALTKKEGGIRPIAVGCTLCRLVSKVAGSRARDKMAALLAPRQLGYGVRGGAEAAVYAARLYMQDLQHRCVLKLDFRNAFNTLRRDKMLQAVQNFAPGLLPFVHASYSSPSSLFWSDKTIQSAEGVQQGDPLGPLLFCLTIHPLVSQLKSELCVWMTAPLEGQPRMSSMTWR